MQVTLTDSDIAEIRRIVNDQDFSAFLLSKTSSFVAAATILEFLLDKIDELENN